MSNVAEEITARWGRLVSVIDDPEGARRVVGLRLSTASACGSSAPASASGTRGSASDGSAAESASDALAAGSAFGSSAAGSAFGSSAAGMMLRLHRDLRRMSGDYGPRSVDLPEPAAGAPQSYGEAFGAKVRFGRDVALLRLPAGVLSGRLSRSDFAGRVRQALTERVGSRSTALADVARTLAVHPRTLQRTLAEEGLTYAEILDCVRRTRASALLGTDLPAAEISARLGFAEPAVLTRSCRRWWGRPPAALRSPPAGWARTR